MNVLPVVWGISFIVWSVLWISSEDYQPAVDESQSLNAPNDIKSLQGEYYEPDCITQDCSWLTYRDNSGFSSNYSILLAESADQDLEAHLGVNEPRLKCNPESFGYTAEQAAEMFPYVGFPACSEKAGRKDSVVQLDTVNNLLTMSCPGWYFLGPPASDERLGYWQYRDAPKRYTGPVHEDKAEWVFGTCKEDRQVDLEGAAYSHRPKAEVLTRTQAAMRDMEQTHSESDITKPLSVIMLTMDSVSRKQFYRKLPLTHSLLASVDPEQFKVFDFKIHNVLGDNSLPNVYPVFTGNPLGAYDKNKNRVQDADLLGEEAIWSYLRQRVTDMQGWTTLFGAEFCDNYFSDGFGKKPEVDHLMTKFWCGAERFSGFK